MARPEQIASALLQSELPNSDVAGVILEMAEVSNVVHMPTPPAAGSVQKILKKGWAKVATAVASGTPEFLGDRLVKHSSVQVRRLLATMSSDEETLRTLHAWGLERDRDTFENALNRLELEWVVAYLESGADGYTSNDLRVVANRVIEEQPMLFDRLMALEVTLSHPLAVAAAPKVAAGLVPGWNLTRLVSENPAVEPQIARHITTGFAETVTAEIAQVLTSSAESRHVLSMNGLHRARAFEPDAARMLLAVDPALGSQIVQTEWAHELFEDFVALKSLDVAETLLRNTDRVRTFSKEELSDLILAVADTATERTDRYRPAVLNPELLNVIEFELDTEVLHAYLRNSNETATWAWLRGLTPQRPRPGEVEALVANPGYAFGYNTNYGAGARSITSSTLEEIASDTAGRVEELAQVPWVDELVDACGSALLEEMVRPWNGAPAYLADRLTRELGNDPDVWRDAIVHMSRSKLSLGRSLNAVRKLRGINKPESPQVPELAPQQLSFDDQIELASN